MAAARTRVKICGVTTPTDARAAADAGADAVGINFHPPSPRSVGPLMAAEIATALPPFVAVVGVFVDPDADRVRRILDRVRLDGLQFSGDESAEFCRAFGLPYIKMAGMAPDFDFAAFEARYPDAQAFLLDTHDDDLAGGTGRSFDWSTWPDSEHRLILAGGLDPDNVAAAIAATQPYAVDVASGVEGDVKGRKDATLVRRFVEEARRA
ncbi:MAG: phosphoribosylanthranilate isomerase [Gammaproteobacteria bacterium]|nr:phosphoribosylanthranilate isomerase [Gammaproteobacteria bacterium]MDE0193616.1 phosphoribosylanthranilate isomerase [Gammaproteobacteria bacterium]